MRKWLMILLAVGLLPVVAGCATNGPAEDAEEPGSDTDALSPGSVISKLPERLTLALKDTTLGAAVRRIGDETGARIVLMSGISKREIESISFVNEDHRHVAMKLAKATSCAVQETPYYYFLYAPGYEALTEISIPSPGTAPFDQNIDRMAFGAEIPLYAVFTWIGQAWNTTVIADQAVAAAPCGEIALRDIPLDRAVEAVLKSALLDPDTLQIDRTGEYIFCTTSANRSPASALLGSDSLSDRQGSYLGEKVSVVLPEPPMVPGKVETMKYAQHLAEVLPSLSTQLGVAVVAESDLADWPVNPSTYSGVSVKTVMDLLIRQWLVPETGYQFTHDRIVIRRRTGDERMGE